MSSSHWAFWVTRPRFEVRLRNSPVDNSGSWPARSLARTDQKNQARTSAPATSRPSISQPLLSAARMPMTTRIRPTADRMAPPGQPDDGRDNQGLEHKGGPPADRLGNQAADQRPRRAPDPTSRADHPEGAGPRGQVGEQQGGEDVDGRDQQGRAHPLQDRVAQDEDAKTWGGRA